MSDYFDDYRNWSTALLRNECPRLRDRVRLDWDRLVVDAQRIDLAKQVLREHAVGGDHESFVEGSRILAGGLRNVGLSARRLQVVASDAALCYGALADKTEVEEIPSEEEMSEQAREAMERRMEELRELGRHEDIPVPPSGEACDWELGRVRNGLRAVNQAIARLAESDPGVGEAAAGRASLTRTTNAMIEAHHAARAIGDAIQIPFGARDDYGRVRVTDRSGELRDAADCVERELKRAVRGRRPGT